MGKNYLIRSKKVILDRDLAKLQISLYGYRVDTHYIYSALNPRSS